MPDNFDAGPSASLGDASAAALADIQSDAGSTVPETTAPPVAADSAASPAEQLYDVKVNGQTVKVPLSELLGGYSRTSDYTQKQQALAEHRRQLEAAAQQMTAREQQVATFLQDPAQVERYLQYLRSQVQQAPQAASSEDLVTMATLQQQLATYQQQMTAANQQQIAEAAIQLTEANYRTELDKHLASLLTAHPELESVQDVGHLLRRDVSTRHPKDLDEAKQFFVEAAAARAEQLATFWTERAKKQAAGAAKLSRGIEPPGGQALPPPSSTAPRFGSTEWKAMIAKEIEASATG